MQTQEIECERYFKKMCTDRYNEVRQCVLPRCCGICRDNRDECKGICNVLAPIEERYKIRIIPKK